MIMNWKFGSIAAVVAVLCLASVQAQAASIVAQWTMDDNATSATVVETVSGNDGTFQDATGNANTDAHAAVGQFGGALEFDGVDDYVATSFAGVNGTAARSVSLWIKGTSVDQDPTPYLVAWGENDSFTGGAAWRMRLTPDGFPRIETNSTGFDGGVNVLDDQWNNIVVTWDGVGVAIIYVNGAIDAASGTLNVNTGPGASAAGNVWIGSAERFDTTGAGGTLDQDNRRFKGLIDDVRIYDYALSQAEVSALVPEPTSLGLLALGLLGVGVCRRRS